MDALALTDTNGLYGLVFFLQAAEEAGVRPIVGAEVVRVRASAPCCSSVSQEGYANLCRILTRRHRERGLRRFPRELAGSSGGLAVLSDSLPLLSALKGPSASLRRTLRGGRLWRPVLDVRPGGAAFRPWPTDGRRISSIPGNAGSTPCSAPST